MNRLGILILAAVGFAGSIISSSAQIVVDVGDHPLLPNTPNQIVRLFVTGGAAVAGLNFNVQVADGVPFVSGGVILGPKLTGVDILGTTIDPTIFFGNNTGQSNPNGAVDPDQIRSRAVTTQNGTVSANGLLAILTLDTTGFDIGVFDLNLKNVFGGSFPTTFVASSGLNMTAAITDGTITVSSVVPEPMSSALVAVSLLGGALWLRRHRKG